MADLIKNMFITSVMDDTGVKWHFSIASDAIRIAVPEQNTFIPSLDEDGEPVLRVVVPMEVVDYMLQLRDKQKVQQIEGYVPDE